MGWSEVAARSRGLLRIELLETIKEQTRAGSEQCRAQATVVA
jgi:hypothetical protein